ncbi:MAG: hypothetical protein EAZ09_11050 [Oscillatoriales cyanobacterium]|nr:MAG: hypothetical protein EAZ18_09820 [Oscillatoriales cyanobacterium]TAH22114.1 MAG: hypothetical protein EAZ09_11050 [Oscillatoriales cyanobacterium]
MPVANGQNAHPTIKLNSCETGILPVADGQDAHPTIKLNSCGTGILPVADGQDAHQPLIKVARLWNNCGLTKAAIKQLELTQV